MNGIRYFLRNFTASAVSEHLRSQLEDSGGRPELTPNEVELVRYVQTAFPAREEAAGQGLEP